MTDRQDGPRPRVEPGDADGPLGALVADVADAWRMPAPRLGERTWAERVEARRRGPLVRPALAAIGLAAAATVVLSLGAVWLSSRPLPSGGIGASSGPASSPSPSSVVASPSATESQAPSTSPLPALAVSDPALRSVRFPVQAGDAQRVLDLSSGRLASQALDGTTGYPAQLLRYGDGTVCLCARAVATRPGALGVQVTALAVDLVERDASGTVVRSVPVTTFSGGLPDDIAGDAIESVTVSTSAGPTPDTAFLGWSIRTAGGWDSGADVVDLRTAHVVQSVSLPAWKVLSDAGPGRTASPTFADAPQVFVSPSGGRVVIEQVRGEYAMGAGGVLGDASRFGPDHWSASFSGGRLGTLTAFESGAGSLDPSACQWASDEALVTDDVFVATCAGSAFTLRRVDASGRPLGDIALSDSTSGVVAFADAPGAVRYAWMPFSRTLLKLDLAAGRVVGRLDAPKPTAAMPGLDGLLGRLGAWIAPSADAKLYFQPAIAMAPDGSRVYLLGTMATDFSEIHAASAGVIVVDTASLTVAATWGPTADFTSIAVSRDGRYVLAAGAPGVDANGTSTESQGASVTVYRAADGTVAGIAGQLGANGITFMPALMP